MSSNYGGFYGGDPRKFYPDPEMCSDLEMAAHAAACREWNKGNRPPDPPGHESTYDAVTGKLIQHIARYPFGIGVTVFDDEEDDGEPEEDLELDEMDDEELLGIYLSNAGHDSEMAARILAERHHAEIASDEDES